MKLPGIKEFPTDEKIWRIDWLGEVDLNPSVPSEPSIEVIISPLVDGKEKEPLSNTSVVHAERRVIKIGVGQFPLLVIGSLWKNGFLLKQENEKSDKFENLLIDETTVRIVRTDHQENGEWLIPPQYHRVGKNGFSAHCLCIELKGDPFGIIIPVSEIIRFYYAVSTDMALALFSGTFRYNLDSIVGEDSGYDEVKKRYFLELCRDLEDENGWVIARILQAPEAAHGAMLIHDSLMSSSTAGSSISPKSAFPFSGKTTLMSRGKNIKSLGKWRQLVYALVRCTANFPFEELEIYRDNDGSSADSKTDLPDEEKKIAYPGKMGVLSSESDGQKIQNESEPDAGIPRFRIPLPGERFAAISGKEIHKPKKEQCLYKSGKVVTGFKKVDIKAFGTGRGGYADTGIAPLSLDVQRVRDKALQASFENFIQMIEWLDTFPGLRAFIRDCDERTEFLPLLKPPRYRQWAYLDSSKKIRRRVIIADVIQNNRYSTLIELERRHSESFSICLLATQDGSKIPNPQIQEILRSVTKECGCWENIKAFPPGIRKSTMKHTRASIHEFAEKVALRLEQLSASLGMQSHMLS